MWAIGPFVVYGARVVGRRTGRIIGSRCAIVVANNMATTMRQTGVIKLRDRRDEAIAYPVTVRMSCPAQRVEDAPQFRSLPIEIADHTQPARILQSPLRGKCGRPSRIGTVLTALFGSIRP
jgi:hypothetical protein